MTIPLFSDDQIPECQPGPIEALRSLEAKLEALKAKFADTDDPTHYEDCWDAKRLELDPSDYEELYNAARAHDAMQREIWALEKKLEDAQEAALVAVRRDAP